MEQQEWQGRITKSSGGFYQVVCAGGSLLCRARGLFRKQGVSPVVGDVARVAQTVQGEGYILELMPRKNVLVRPPLANIDRFVLVLSMKSPAPNFLVADKMLAIAVRQGMEPVLAVTKTDLASPADVAARYEKTGFPLFFLHPEHEDGYTKLKGMLQTGVSAFCGNTGAGKSTLLNRLDPTFALATGETSKKLGRGRHTTRHVELHAFGEGYLADTPGFSAVDVERYGTIPKEELAGCFPEFIPYLERCRFTGCSHTVEKGCAVLEQVEGGRIHQGRHENYCGLYREAKNQEKW